MDSALVVKGIFFELQSATGFDADACIGQTRPRAETDSIVDYCFGLAAESDGAKLESAKFGELSPQDTSVGSSSDSSPSDGISWNDLCEEEDEDVIAPVVFPPHGPPGYHMPQFDASQNHGPPGFHMHTSNAESMVYMMTPMHMYQYQLAAEPSIQTQLDSPSSMKPTLACTSQKRSKGKRAAATGSKQPVDISTTLVIRQLPKSLGRDDVARLLDSHGLAGVYDFLSTPVDFKTDLGLGFAIANFEDESAVSAALSKLAGCQIDEVELVVELSKKHRGGLAALIERYRDSPLMDAGVPDAYKPALFSHGCRIPFPMA